MQTIEIHLRRLCCLLTFGWLGMERKIETTVVGL